MSSSGSPLPGSDKRARAQLLDERRTEAAAKVVNGDEDVKDKGANPSRKRSASDVIKEEGGSESEDNGTVPNKRFVSRVDRPELFREINEDSEASISTGAADWGNDEVDEETRLVLKDIEACQTELDEMNEKASEEILKVETKYNKLRTPLFKKRSGMIEKVSKFWVNALSSHPQISVLLTEEEEDCLHFLSKLEVEEFENVEDGYRIKLTFMANPFFENEELIKEFHLGPTKEPKSTSTPIKWKADMDLTKIKAEKVNKGDDGKEELDEGPKSFFCWFLDNSNPTDDEIAELIKDDLWTNPIQYYLAGDLDDTDDFSEFEEEEISMDDEELEEAEEEEEGDNN